jgi:hypothetical protein
MFLIYGLLAVILGFVLLWWLPDRPLAPGQKRVKHGFMKFLPATPEVLKGEDALVHYQDLRRVYHARPWTFKDLGYVLIDWRLWPLVLMYFGVVGVGIGTQLYGNVIIASINPNFSGVEISLLFAPIWLVSIMSVLQDWGNAYAIPRWISRRSFLSRRSPTGFTVIAPCSSPQRFASRLLGS